MNRNLLVPFIVFLVIAPVGIVHFRSDDHENISALNYPELNITGIGNTSYTISYVGIGFRASFMNYHMVSFRDKEWNRTENSNGISYHASFDLFGNSFMEKEFGFREFPKEFGVTVFINFTKYTGNYSRVIIGGNSTVKGNITVDQIENKTIEMSSTIITNSKIPFPLKLFLIQKISGFDLSTHQNFTFSQFMVRTDNHGNRWDGIGLMSSHHIKGTRAIYWWSSEYSMAGLTFPLATVISPSHGSIYVGFVYSIPSNQKGKIGQDPYFTFVSHSISHLPIKGAVKKIVNYVAQNETYFSIGLILGSALILSAYVSYRRRRI